MISQKLIDIVQNNPGNKTKIITIGNEKGGAGKTTCSMHLVSSLLFHGKSVVSIDIDSRQLSLTSYIKNRSNYVEKYKEDLLADIYLNPHFAISTNDVVNYIKPNFQYIENNFLKLSKLSKTPKSSKPLSSANLNQVKGDQEKNPQEVYEEFIKLDQNISSLSKTDVNSISKLEDIIIHAINMGIEFIVIDTPGNFNELNMFAHLIADIIITPINDSFVDLDVIAKIDRLDLDMKDSSSYSSMIWSQKMQRAKLKLHPSKWFVMRNRLSFISAKNKDNMSEALAKTSKMLGFQIIPGLSERVIFRELFLEGLTLFDIDKVKDHKNLTLSHVGARAEVRHFINQLFIL